MRPLMTLPTTRPRSASGASVAAKGTSNCAITDVRPMSPAAAMKKPIDGATAAGHQSGDGDRRQRRDEPPPLEEVAERQQQDQACRVADLGGCDDEAGDRRRHTELAAEGVEERLRQVVAGHGLTGRDREQEDEAAAHAAADDVLRGAGRVAHTT